MDLKIMDLRMRIVFVLFFIFWLLPYTGEAGVSIAGDLVQERITEIGTNYQGAIFIKNNGDSPEEVKVYQTDYLFFADGRSLYGEPGKIARSNAQWITYSPKRHIIPAKQESAVNYRIEVPNDNSLTGTYWSMLMVEGVGKASFEQKEEVKIGIRQVIRYGIQIVTHIGAGGSNKLKFIDTKLLKKEGRRYLQITMENIGQRCLIPLLWTELYDGQGNYKGKFEGRKLRTYPGTSIRQRIDLTDVREGKYKALVIADAGEDNVFGMIYNLHFEK